jgi:hypothetical protein
MKLINTLDFPDFALRRMVSWVCREVGLPVRHIREIRFSRSRASYSGLHRGGRLGCRLGVRLGPVTFPHVHCRFGVSSTWNDAWDLLVAIAAHEVGHAHDYRERGTTDERCAELHEREVLRVFQASRETLLAEWLVAPSEKPAKPRASIQEKRAAKAAAKLAEWQRKVKLANTKVKQYRRQVAYYERSLAAKR